MNTVELFYDGSHTVAAVWKGKSVKEVAAVKYPTSKLNANPKPPRSIDSRVDLLQIYTLDDDQGFVVWLMEVP